jgi:hypothetical protein
MRRLKKWSRKRGAEDSTTVIIKGCCERLWRRYIGFFVYGSQLKRSAAWTSTGRSLYRCLKKSHVNVGRRLYNLRVFMRGSNSRVPIKLIDKRAV